MKTRSKQDKIAYVVMAQAEGYRPEVCPSVCGPNQLDREVWYAEQFFKQRQEEQNMNNVERDPMMPQPGMPGMPGSASNYYLPPKKMAAQEHPRDVEGRPCEFAPDESRIQGLYTLVTRQLDGVRIINKQLRELRDRLGGEYPPLVAKAPDVPCIQTCGIISDIRADVVCIDDELCMMQTIIDQLKQLA